MPLNAARRRAENQHCRGAHSDEEHSGQHCRSLLRFRGRYLRIPCLDRLLCDLPFVVREDSIEAAGVVSRRLQNASMNPEESSGKESGDG